MKKLRKAVAKGLKRLYRAAVKLYRRYPARANSYIVAALVAGAGAIGVVISPESAATIVKTAVPVLLAGEATHHLVKPTKSGT